MGNSVQGLLFALLLGIGGAAVVRKWRRDWTDVWLFVAGFVLRVVVGLLLSQVIEFRYDDEISFHNAALNPSEYLTSFGPGSAYYNTVTLLYVVFGPNDLFPRIVNALLGSLLPFLIFDVTYQIGGDKRSSKLALVFSMFLPPLVIYSAVSLKEIGTAVLLFLPLWILGRENWRSRVKWLLILLATLMLLWFRGAAWASFGIAGVLIYFAARVELRSLCRLRRPTLIAYLTVALLVAILLALGVSQLVSERVLAGYPELMDHSDATVARFIDSEKPFGARTLSVLLIRGIFFPTPLRTLLELQPPVLIDSLVMIVWYALAPIAMIGYLRFPRDPMSIANATEMTFVFVTIVLAVSLGSDILRHRIPIFPQLYVLAAIGINWPIDRRGKGILVAWWTAALLLTVLWVSVRMI